MDGAKPDPKEVTPKRSAPDSTKVVGKTARRRSQDENTPPPATKADMPGPDPTNGFPTPELGVDSPSH
jgi:hypothetical protein|tara:strand:- start:686 stop:889 length:204 start_codon:yes stop_codon:yes gene_type:complete